jgi:hypothetical protein
MYSKQLNETPYECRLPNETPKFLFYNMIFTMFLFNNRWTHIHVPIGNIYDRSSFGKTFSEEANFTCHHSVRSLWL